MATKKTGAAQDIRSASRPTRKKASPVLAVPFDTPALSGLTTEGTPVRASLYQGKWVVVYFYPRDLTPGCTLESRDFQRLADSFRGHGAVVIGVSKDSCESHRTFVEKEGLSSVTLLSDAAGRLCEDFGVWKEKINYGRTYMGIERTTFLIDPQGRVRARWERVKVDGHAQAVLDTLAALRG